MVRIPLEINGTLKMSFLVRNVHGNARFKHLNTPCEPSLRLGCPGPVAACARYHGRMNLLMTSLFYWPLAAAVWAACDCRTMGPQPKREQSNNEQGC